MKTKEVQKMILDLKKELKKIKKENEKQSVSIKKLKTVVK